MIFSPPTGLNQRTLADASTDFFNTIAAKATFAARRTHFVIGREERRPGAPATRCPEPDRDEKLRARFENMSGTPAEPKQEGCKPVPGSEGHVLVLAVSFLRSAEAATVPGARSAAEVLGMSAPAPTSPAHPQSDGGSDGAPPGN